jgi:Oxidoreductase family, NAD-binding Rossmann fold
MACLSAVEIAQNGRQEGIHALFQHAGPLLNRRVNILAGHFDTCETETVARSRITIPARTLENGKICYTNSVSRALSLDQFSVSLHLLRMVGHRAAQIVRGSVDHGQRGELLNRESLDIVGVCGDNGERAEIVLECAKRKIHIVAEKPLVITMADLDRSAAERKAS